MITKEITICDTQLTLSYCYAVEIGYKIMADQNIHDFFDEVGKALSKKKMPDIQRTVYLIMASTMAYYESREEKAPITDKQLIYECSKEDLSKALLAIITLYNEFFKVPSDELTESEKQPDGKNV